MKRILTAWLACSVTGAFQPVLAQAASNEEELAVDTVIVNVRKTDEALSDVPVSANVLSGDDIADRVLEKFDDFIRITPGTTVVNAGPDYNTDISIRGQGGGRNGFSESATGIYRNGIYVAGGGFGGRSFNRLDLFDVGQFEVYRGPQGALYGRNAVGGAVNVITNQPDPDGLSGFGKVTYDDRQRLTTEGVFNAPIGGDSAVRIGGFYTDQSDGFVTNINTGKVLDTEKVWGARGALRVGLTPDWAFTLTTESYETEESPSFSDLGRRLPVGAGQFDPGNFDRISSRDGNVEIEETTVFAELEGDLEGAALTAVITYKDRDAGRFNDDLDKFLGFQGVNASDLSVGQTEAFERVGAEIRLASDSSSAVRWLAGADFQTFDDAIATINGGTSNTANLRELGQRTDTSTEELMSWSAFGLLEGDIVEVWTLAGELRVLVDDRDFVFQRIDRVPVPVNGSIAPVRASRNDTAVLPVITLRRTLAEGAQVYVRGASGFRPGGFNSGTANVDALPYAPEKAFSGEVGYKASVAGWNFSTAAYYQRSDDLQIVTTVSLTDTTTVLQNVPRADYWGFEAEARRSFDLGPGRLALNGSFSTADGEFGDASLITVNGTPTDISGDRVNRVRDYQVVLNGLYSLPLGENLRGFLNLAAQAEGGGFENATGGGNRPTGRPLEDFSRLDIRMGFEAGRWRVSGFVQNVTDEIVVLQTLQSNEFYSTPRIVGVDVTYRWADKSPTHSGLQPSLD